MRCQGCAGERCTKAGRDREGCQVHRCAACGRRQTVHSTSAFSGYHFPSDIIALAVRWYLHYRLSYADVAELLPERGVHVNPSTVYDWVQAFTPLYREAARAYRHPVRGTWAVDETYIKVGGVLMYVFRAIDEHGQVVDVFVSSTRDTAEAVAFLQGTIEETGVRPRTVTTDKAAISTRPGRSAAGGDPQRGQSRDAGDRARSPALEGTLPPDARVQAAAYRPDGVRRARLHAQPPRRLLPALLRVAQPGPAPPAAPANGLGGVDDDPAGRVAASRSRLTMPTARRTGPGLSRTQRHPATSAPAPPATT